MGDDLRMMAAPDLINLVEDKLWIGGIDAALDTKLLLDKQINCVVTVDKTPLIIHSETKYLHISVHDLCTEDLFAHFETVFHFIEKGKELGGVLVHCFHGVSRSAALIISYLIKKYNISAEIALVKVKQIRPSVQPNDGFMSQLRLYHILLRHNQLNSIITHSYFLSTVVTKIREGYLQDEITSSFTPVGERRIALKCKKCRYVLASYGDIINHKYGEDPNWKEGKWVTHALNEERCRNSCTKAFFVVPMNWMVLGGELKGKLQCPKCDSKVGAFDWVQNVKCPCNASFLPSFYLIASKVDFVK